MAHTPNKNSQHKNSRNKRRYRKVQQILDVLTEYRRAHPKAKIDAYRHSPGSLRIRIIDPDFQGVDWGDREHEVWPLLEKLPEDVQADITFLLLLTPVEKKTSWAFANMEYEDPIPSPMPRL